ncbi:glutamate mutase L [Glycomyces sp. NRRL B-16210]|uniref:glutamate mutase L n=1 Tax=Glycomyces sp. NRRL B-16210 TaxID=1463821 RepID=UPI0004C0C18D|nr:glutamate mutase L [Glycomyces sp. NRRL B-16210]
MNRHSAAPVVLCVDVGSTYTKAAAIDAATGALRGTASHPTTLDTDVMDGLLAAAVEASPSGAEITDTLVCSSAGGGLRLAVIGNEPLVTARAAYRAGLSAGARVVDVRAGHLTPGDFTGLAAARPDVVLLAGGTDGGDETALRTHAEDLAASGLRTPVVLAGNANAAADLTALLTAAGIGVTAVDNVLPRIGDLNPAPARGALREVFLRHVIAGKHLSASADFTRLVKAATPDAVLTGVEVLADLLAGTDLSDLLVVDVGGATTDVYSVLTPDAELQGPRAEVAGTAWRSRTVEGDLGVRHTAVGIVEAAAEEDLPVPAGLAEAARRRGEDPGLRTDDLADDAELSALAARIAVRRHARGERIGGPTEPLRGGKDLAAVGLVVGSGGVLRRDPEAAERLREAVGGDTSGGVRPPKDSRFAVDADYRLAPAGLLAANGHRDLAARLLAEWPAIA